MKIKIKSSKQKPQIGDICQEINRLLGTENFFVTENPSATKGIIETFNCFANSKTFTPTVSLVSLMLLDPREGYVRFGYESDSNENVITPVAFAIEDGTRLYEFLKSIKNIEDVNVEIVSVN